MVAWGTDRVGAASVPASLNDKTVVAISAGLWHSMALTDEGKVYAWGADRLGQSSIPESVEDEIVVDIVAGDERSSVLTAEGEIISWGYNAYGQNNVPSSLDDKIAFAISTKSYCAGHRTVVTAPGHSRHVLYAQVTDRRSSVRDDDRD